jgi:hypothetical protein
MAARKVEMADALHPEATHHLPIFITPPGQTDVLMVVTAGFLALAVITFGVLYFRLHSLPEHIAHKSQKVQMELVAVLCLIALFTHMHIFWIAGLILAFIDMPDFGTPLRRIARSVEKMVGIEPPAETEEVEPKAVAAAGHHDVAREPPVEAGESKPIEQAPALAMAPAEEPRASVKKPAVAPTKKEPSHA